MTNAEPCAVSTYTSPSLTRFAVVKCFGIGPLLSGENFALLVKFAGIAARGPGRAVSGEIACGAFGP
jgi:hypothetical protein